MRGLRAGFIVILLATLWAGLPPALAQGGNIAYGQSVGGYIAYGGIDSWSFYGSAGDVISITMYADGGSSLDTYLWLYNSSGTQVASNDDYYGLDAAILGFTLPSADTYTIQASGAGEGGYTLWLTLDSAGAPAQPPANPTINSISYGQTLSGTIPASAPAILGAYAFTGTQGDQVTITVVAQTQGFDPNLVLLNSNDSQIAYDDDSYGNLNPIISLSLPYTGAYTAYVGAVNQASFGDYTISLAGSASGVQPPPVAQPTVINISYGQALSGDIPASARDILKTYAFNGMQGDQVTITVVAQTQSFDPYLVLLNSSDSQIAFDDDSYGNLNPIISLSLPYTSAYTIYVGAVNQASFGNFTISLDGSALGIPPAAPDIQPLPSAGAQMLPSAQIGSLLPGFGVPNSMVMIDQPQVNVPPPTMHFWVNYGDIVNGEFVSNPYQNEWLFNGNRGDVVTISMTAQTQGVDPRLALLDPDGNVLDQDDDSLGNFNAQIANVTLPVTGTYIIDARAANNFPGIYSLELAGTPASPAGGEINYYERKANVCCASTDTTEQHTWQFDAKQGDVLSIIMTADTSDMVPWLYLLRYDGVVMAENHNPLGSQTITINYTVPYDMRMMILPLARSGRGTYTLDLQYMGTAGDTAGGLIAYSQTIVDSVSAANQSDQWIMYAEAGDKVLIMMYFLDPNMDPFLILTDYSGSTTLAQHDDINSTNRNARIEYTFTQTGNYVIRATASNSMSYGRYMLALLYLGQ